jgi:hypothetical protein
MRRFAALLPLLAFLALTPLAVHGQSYEDLAGGWVVSSWTSPEGVMDDTPQPGLVLFTAQGQYSMMYVNVDEPRPDLADDPSDADVLEAYSTFTANSGRYRINGSEIAIEAFVAKSPNYMGGWDPDNGGNLVTLQMSLADGVLTLEWANGRKATLTRPPGVAGGG